MQNYRAIAVLCLVDKYRGRFFYFQFCFWLYLTTCEATASLNAIRIHWINLGFSFEYSDRDRQPGIALCISKCCFDCRDRFESLSILLIVTFMLKAWT